MDKYKLALALIALLLAASLLGIAYLLGENASLARGIDTLNRTSSQKIALMQSDYSALSSKYSISQQELSDTGAQLSQANASLSQAQAQLLQTEQALNESRESLAGQQQRVDALNQEFSTLESTINSSIAWFRDNAYMPANYTWTTDIFMSRVVPDCADGGALNLACISYLMENTAFSIHYRSDSVSGSADHLQGVKETIGLGWGDCEDYSLIFKAILNSVRQKNASLRLVAWQPAETGEFRIYPKATPGETGPYWAYTNAAGVDMGSPSQAYVACYTVDAASGHCIVALSGNNVAESTQVPLLSGAYLFEPQSGRYLGKIGESLQMCGGSGCKSETGKIWLVISDNDLYIYGDNGWQGYADYLSRVSEERASLPN